MGWSIEGFVRDMLYLLSPLFARILAMNSRFAELLKRLTPEEEIEVATFTAAVLARRKTFEPPILGDDISSADLIQLVADAGSFDWLDAPEEDIYSVTDGKEVQWNVPL